MSIAPSQTDVFNVPTPPYMTTIGPAFHCLSVKVRNMIFGFFLSLLAAVSVYADERLQDWIPDILTIPQDAKVVTDRSIGSTVRMFAITTNADAETLFSDWEESLKGNGYPVKPGADNLSDRSIEFSGPGIANAKIILAPANEDAGNLIEFDATLN